MIQTKKRDINIIIIKIMTLALLVIAVVVAAANYGFAKNLNPSVKHFWKMLYFYFEHFFRAFTVFLGSLLTYRFIKKSTGRVPLQRKITLFSFSITSLLLLVIWPIASGYWELYYAFMPFPWTTLPFQLAMNGKFYGTSLPPWKGIDSATLLLWAYGIYQVIAFAGTIVLGRKWQCSMICLMNGCHAETLGIGLPFIIHNKKRPHSKQIKPVLHTILILIQRILFTVNILLTGLWSCYLITGWTLIPENTLIRIELIKYISLELTLLMFLWVFIGGRGYCFYCPAGFGLALISRLIGQRVETGLTHCIQCSACNDACKMSIDIMARVQEKKPVRDISCVGCGLCMDNCPTGNLLYRTHLFRGFGSNSTRSY
ncbi:MAG: hypothetical protein JXB88_20910 [Spirochaetales bacterium]|nr:hypothetical protein [Spirochaetales bacterium]